MLKIQEIDRPLVFALVFLAVALLAVAATSLLPTLPQQRPEIQSEKKSDSGLKGQKQGQSKNQITRAPSANITAMPAEYAQGQRGQSTKHSKEQGTEFWPPFFGVRIKITDSLLALFTLFLTVFTGLLWRSTNLIEKHSVDTERAYVKISHAKDFEQVDSTSVRFAFEIKNLGHTPARIKDVIIEMHSGGPPGPQPPPFSTLPRNKVSGFLVSGDKLFHHVTYNLTASQVAAMRQGILNVWLFGIVDYDDIFGQCHQVGYGRIFSSIANEFVFINSDQFNYDRTRSG